MQAIIAGMNSKDVLSRSIPGTGAADVAADATAVLDPRLGQLALYTLIALIALCVLWETILAPIRPGGSLLFLKALPLAFAVRGVARRSLYTMQWASMLVLIYLMEGVVRAMSDPQGLSRALASLEIALSLTFFLCAIFYVRPAKRLARRAAKTPSAAGGSGR